MGRNYSYILVIAILAFGVDSYCQKQGNVWYFGNEAGVDFNSGSPVAITDGQLGLLSTPNQGTTAISDSSGYLLFYSDGVKVWNALHDTMPNGTGLFGSEYSTQSALIIPAPENPNRYFYLFTVSAATPSYPTEGLSYSKIDMTLDGGNGDVMATEKNIMLATAMPSRLAATRHQNGSDYWILSHKHNTDEFWAFLLTDAGITDTVISAIGSVHGSGFPSSSGQVKFSPNGQKVVIGTANILNILELFDFDNATGALSNALDLDVPNADMANTYGVEFSPDNNKLYASGRSSSGIVYSMLWQYDLTAGGGDILAINASMYLVFEDFAGLVGGVGLQLGPDDKIYTVSLNDQHYLSSIENPNALGSACNWVDLSVYLNGKQAYISVPSFVANYDYSNTISDFSEIKSDKTEWSPRTRLFPNPASESCKVEFSDLAEVARITILDGLGRTTMEIGDVTENLDIDLKWLQPGIYIVLIEYLDSKDQLLLVVR